MAVRQQNETAKLTASASIPVTGAAAWASGDRDARVHRHRDRITGQHSVPRAAAWPAPAERPSRSSREMTFPRRFVAGQRRTVSGAPTVKDEASDVRWFTAADFDSLDIHPSQRRQLRNWL